MDSDESSSLRSSSTETTNVDERSSLTEYQQFTKQPTGIFTLTSSKQEFFTHFSKVKLKKVKLMKNKSSLRINRWLQVFNNVPTFVSDPVILWKKPNRFEVVLAKSTATEESSTDPNLNERSNSSEGSRESKLTNFHLSLSEIGSDQASLAKRIIALQENSDDFSFGLHSPDSFPNEIFTKVSLKALLCLK
jgi:hypothetical protein